MPEPATIACCYCGLETLLTRGKGRGSAKRYALVCEGCGAPLRARNLKVSKPAVQHAWSRTPLMHKPPARRVKPAKAADDERRGKWKPKRRRKSVLKRAEDLIEDLFDEIFD